MLERNRDEPLAHLLQDYQPVLRHAIRQTLPAASSSDTDDIVQETSLRLLRAVRDKRPIENLRSYAYRVAVSAALDAMRRLKRRREDPLEPAGDGQEDSSRGHHERPYGARSSHPERRAAQRQTLDRINRLMAELGDNRRRAVALHIRGLTPAEIGDLLGWTETKSRNLVYRGLRELRSKLNDQGVSHDWS